jgi:hypothetical protein
MATAICWQKRVKNALAEREMAGEKFLYMNRVCAAKEDGVPLSTAFWLRRLEKRIIREGKSKECLRRTNF